MYIGIDVGGTKTIVACLNQNGEIVEKQKFPTPDKYEDFLAQVAKAVESFEHQDFKAAAAGIPAVRIDRQHGRAINFGNLDWKDVDIVNDIENIVKCPTYIENDAKLGGLSEAMLIKDRYSKVLYVTISTGIGYAIIDHENIDTNAGDAGGHDILINHGGKYVLWEEMASGHAIVDRFGKMAKDLDSKEAWESVARDLGEGLIELIAIFQPEVIVLGGAVGKYFDKYSDMLKAELKKYELPLIKLPALKGAERADDAVIYGCYDYAKQVVGHG